MSTQTIGKRIQALRKERGLTQKQLAELIGVTPQAVSKWETDESCPDISILSSLANVLGVSTDELLGADTQQRDIPVREGEVVDPMDDDGDKDRNEFHFAFSVGKLGGILFGLFLLSAGVLLFLTKQIGWFTENDISFWSLLWPTALIFVGLTGLIGRDFSGFSLGMVLLGAICLLNNLGVIRIDNIWLLIVVGLLVIIGISIIVSQFTKKKPKYQKKGSPRYKYCDLDGVIDYEAAFGHNDTVAKAVEIAEGKIKTSFGDYSLDLRGVTGFRPNARLTLDISFGDFTLYLPKTVRVESDKDGSFSSFEMNGSPSADAPYILMIHSTVNFGELTIKY